MMLVSSSGWAHSPMTLIFTASLAVYGAAEAAGTTHSAIAMANSTPKRLTPAPLRTTSNRDCVRRYSRCQVARLPSAVVRWIAGVLLLVGLALPASAHAAPALNVDLARESVRYGQAHRVDGTFTDGTRVLADQEVVLE